jgi:hypothetical protein
VVCAGEPSTPGTNYDHIGHSTLVHHIKVSDTYKTPSVARIHNTSIGGSNEEQKKKSLLEGGGFMNDASWKGKPGNLQPRA